MKDNLNFQDLRVNLIKSTSRYHSRHSGNDSVGLGHVSDETNRIF